MYPFDIKKRCENYLAIREVCDTLECQRSMETCSLIFWKMCTETLLFGSNTVIDFSTNIETEIKGKDRICPASSAFALCIAQV